MYHHKEYYEGFFKGTTMRDRIDIEEKKKILLKMTSDFCREHLNEEYKELCEKLILKMSRKRNVPFLSGRLNI